MVFWNEWKDTGTFLTGRSLQTTAYLECTNSSKKDLVHTVLLFLEINSTFTQGVKARHVLGQSHSAIELGESNPTAPEVYCIDWSLIASRGLSESSKLFCSGSPCQVVFRMPSGTIWNLRQARRLGLGAWELRGHL